MSLVGVRAKNHPQQVASRGARDEDDDRAIRDEDFAPLHKRFHFTIDAAASPHNAKLPRYWTREDDALSQSWARERVWCNPPYSEIHRWIEKAWFEVGRDPYDGQTPQLIVMLLPANRTEQRWWQKSVEPYRGKRRVWDGRMFDVEFLPGRMRFDRPDWTPGPKGDRPPFGCCLLIWGQA